MKGAQEAEFTIRWYDWVIIVVLSGGVGAVLQLMGLGS